MAIRHFRVLSILNVISAVCFGIVAATIDRAVDAARQSTTAVLAFVCSAFVSASPALPMGARVVGLPALTVSKVRSFYHRLVARVGDQRKRSALSTAFIAA